MAVITSKYHQGLVIYEVFVRNHSPEGAFKAVEADLPRIKDMGVDIVWFMPIYPIGKVRRKGADGSPYAILDYRAVNPEYGTLEDFRQLVETAHGLGLKVMIDVVYNHTAPESVLVQDHPEWFHQDEQGVPYTTVPEWSDVIDLKPGDPALEDYLVESLKFWVRQGVDGFRCDVASVIPLALWQRARRECGEINPEVVWLAESTHAGFIEDRRRRGLSGNSDSQLYEAFDLTYDYDIWPAWEATVAGEVPLNHYLGLLRLQDAIYPQHYVKIRCVENHDQIRIMGRVPHRNEALAWTAFQAFNKGAFLIYAGQESEANHTPSLFDKDTIDWGYYSLQGFLTRLTRIKKDPVVSTGTFKILSADPAITAHWQAESSGLFGIFNVEGNSGVVKVALPDGFYMNLLTGEKLIVAEGRTGLPEHAAIVRYLGEIAAPVVYSPLLDFHPGA